MRKMEMKIVQICFLRVSKVESQQARSEGREPKQLIEDQLTAIEDKFDISFDPHNIIRDEGSAYDMDKIHKRTGFLELINLIFNSDKTTITDVFLKKRSDICFELYAWDYDRFMRNMERSVMFQALNDIFDITIYSFKDGKTLKREDETPTEKVARYMLVAMRAYSAEQYSYTIAENIKKTVLKEDKEKKIKITHSTKGHVWGRKFTNINGEKITLSPEEATKIRNFIMKKIKFNEKKNKKAYGPKLKKEVAAKYSIVISDAYLSNRRKEI